MQLEQIVSRWPYAVFVIERPAGKMVRPVAHLFDIEGGFVWVEPGYLDPFGAPGHTTHTFKGQITEQAEDYRLVGNHSGRLELFVGQDDGGALAWYIEELKRRGLTWEGEHEKLRKAIAQEA